MTVLPPQERPEEFHTLRVNHQFDQHQMSLADGEFFFGETRAKAPKKDKKKQDFNSALESSNLPQDVIDSIKRSVAEKKNGSK